MDAIMGRLIDSFLAYICTHGVCLACIYKSRLQTKVLLSLPLSYCLFLIERSAFGGFNCFLSSRRRCVHQRFAPETLSYLVVCLNEVVNIFFLQILSIKNMTRQLQFCPSISLFSQISQQDHLESRNQLRASRHGFD